MQYYHDVSGDVLLLDLCLSVISDAEKAELFEMLYRKYRLVLIDDAYRIIKDFDYAQDIVQEAYYRIAKNIDRMDFRDEPLPLLRTVTRNCAYNMYAKLKREKGIIDLEEHNAEKSRSFEDEMENRSDAELIADFVEKMSPEYADVFTLKYVHDLPSVQIADLLDIKAATVRKRLQRIRRAVSEKLYRGDEK